MAIYTVHVPVSVGDIKQRAERTAFVRDGFSVRAFVFGPFYFLAHRAFMAAAAWIVGVAVIASVNHILHLPLWADALLAGLIMLFTGLEANSVRRLTLYRQGLEAAGVVNAGSLEEGEAVFFRAQADRLTSQGPGTGAGVVRSMPTGVIGLFPDAGT